MGELGSRHSLNLSNLCRKAQVKSFQKLPRDSLPEQELVGVRLSQSPKKNWGHALPSVRENTTHRDTLEEYE